jgi:hypothetical protein
MIDPLRPPGDLPPIDPLEAAERLMHVLAKMISVATWLKLCSWQCLVLLCVIWGMLKILKMWGPKVTMVVSRLSHGLN